MKKLAGSLVMVLLLSSPTWAAGLMKPANGSFPALAIKSHKVRVVINNGFAVTEVDQIFQNPHEEDLEAIYTFPLPRNASLSELSLWIDGREVVGEVIEKEKARKVYEEQRASGSDAALAEKREYIAFDVFVSPVRARSETRVRLVYMQPLEIDAGVGRYVYPLEEGDIDQEAMSFWERLPRVREQLSFECAIRSAYPLDDVRAKGYDHLSRVSQVSTDTWIVNIDSEEGGADLNEDIVVYYRLAENLPARVDLLPYRVEGEDGTFMIVVTPGADLEPISEGVDWTVILDISGSMASKIPVAADGVARAMDSFRPEDRFRIIVFSDKARYLVRPWEPVTPGSIDEAARLLQGLSIEGGTNLHAGVKLGLKDLEADRTSAVILVSDGGANVGPTEHSAFLALLAQKDVRIFTFVMGQGANVPLLDRLAKESGGFSMDVSNRDDLHGRILQAKSKMGREALHGVRLDLDGVRVRELAPAKLPSAYFGQQIVLFGRYGEGGDATLRLKARISGEEKEWSTRVHLPESDRSYPELERLWALARIQDIKAEIDLKGESSDRREAIVDLGTAYSIVTDYTSMVVVPEEEFERRGIDRRNRDRVDAERAARQVRASQYAPSTRADSQQPMFQGRSSGFLGGGAMSPFFVVFLSVLVAVKAWFVHHAMRH